MVDGERGVLVKVLEVGLDGTDKEIIQALYGKAPRETITLSSFTNPSEWLRKPPGR